jgi:hypothetical protein
MRRIESGRSVYVCVCVCMRERERERTRMLKKEAQTMNVRVGE